VNNAAVFFHKPIEEFTLAEFDTTVAVNFRAPFLLSREAVIGMRDRGWGRIVNIVSIGARHGGLSHSAVYSATKGAMVALTKAFARFYAADGITANAVAPGAVNTFMTAHWTPQDYEKYMPQIPVGRIAEPSELAAAVAFLASDSAAYITGATLDVNGGWLMP
jgi:NAD(P)-dependent dehydrogenase (short-subunit alcohol dehydrogenase family)